MSTHLHCHIHVHARYLLEAEEETGTLHSLLPVFLQDAPVVPWLLLAVITNGIGQSHMARASSRLTVWLCARSPAKKRPTYGILRCVGLETKAIPVQTNVKPQPWKSSGPLKKRARPKYHDCQIQKAVEIMSQESTVEPRMRRIRRRYLCSVKNGTEDVNRPDHSCHKRLARECSPLKK